jgi:hypothetical protein
MHSSQGLGPILFVLVEQTAMEPNARILAGNSSKCDYTLQLLNKRRSSQLGKNPIVDLFNN